MYSRILMVTKNAFFGKVPSSGPHCQADCSPRTKCSLTHYYLRWYDCELSVAQINNSNLLEIRSALDSEASHWLRCLTLGPTLRSCLIFRACVALSLFIIQ